MLEWFAVESPTWLRYVVVAINSMALAGLLVGFLELYRSLLNEY